jgi:hypothetical protein
MNKIVILLVAILLIVPLVSAENSLVRIRNFYTGSPVENAIIDVPELEENFHTNAFGEAVFDIKNLEKVTVKVTKRGWTGISSFVDPLSKKPFGNILSMRPFTLYSESEDENARISFYVTQDMGERTNKTFYGDERFNNYVEIRNIGSEAIMLDSETTTETIFYYENGTPLDWGYKKESYENQTEAQLNILSGSYLYVQTTDDHFDIHLCGTSICLINVGPINTSENIIPTDLSGKFYMGSTVKYKLNGTLKTLSLTTPLFYIDNGGVNWSEELIAPNFDIIPEDESINVGQNWQGVQFESSDPDGVIGYFLNDSQFKISIGGLLINSTSLAVGSYPIEISVKDIFGNTNSTSFILTVNKAIPTATLTNDKAWTRTYDETNNTIGIEENNEGDDDVSYILMRNGVEVTNPDSVSEIGTYDYYIKIIGGANYTSVDNVGVQTLTINEEVIVEPPTPPSSGGGGGGGSQTDTTRSLDLINSKAGDSITIEKGETIYITLKGIVKPQKHNFILSEIRDDGVDIEIQSDPIFLTMRTGEIRYIDTDGNLKDDLMVKLVSVSYKPYNIKGNTALFEIKEINKEELEGTILQTTTGKVLTGAVIGSNSNFVFIPLALFLLILILLSVFVLIKTKR